MKILNASIQIPSQIKNLLKGFEYAKSTGKNVHLMGLLSDGGVHSSQKHLHKLCDMAKQHGLDDVFIHAFTDGRDCNPKTGLSYIQELTEFIDDTDIQIASIVGRYYALVNRVRTVGTILEYGAAKQCLVW